MNECIAFAGGLFVFGRAAAAPFGNPTVNSPTKVELTYHNRNEHNRRIADAGPAPPKDDASDPFLPNNHRKLQPLVDLGSRISSNQLGLKVAQKLRQLLKNEDLHLLDIEDAPASIWRECNKRKLLQSIC